MDIIWLAAFLIIVALAFYALERLPLPAQPVWLRRVIEALVAIGAIIILMQRAGVSLPGTH